MTDEFQKMEREVIVALQRKLLKCVHDASAIYLSAVRIADKLIDNEKSAWNKNSLLSQVANTSSHLAFLLDEETVWVDCVRPTSGEGRGGKENAGMKWTWKPSKLRCHHKHAEVLSGLVARADNPAGDFLSYRDGREEPA